MTRWVMLDEELQRALFDDDDIALFMSLLIASRADCCGICLMRDRFLRARRGICHHRPLKEKTLPHVTLTSLFRFTSPGYYDELMRIR